MGRLKITSREYKIVLNHQLFEARKQAIEMFSEDLHNFTRSIPKTSVEGKFEPHDDREITFLDTVSNTVNLNGLLLRERRHLNTKRLEYTLKCRSPDRYLAADGIGRTTENRNETLKFEEDIATPFVSRFSRSNTIGRVSERPKTLGEAAKLFPKLLGLFRDGRKCDSDTKLEKVSSIRVHERVYKGVVFSLCDTKAECALIFWSNGKNGRSLIGEFSFRYGQKDERFNSSVSIAAMSIYQRLLKSDWFIPDSETKTQFMYCC